LYTIVVISFYSQCDRNVFLLERNRENFHVICTSRKRWSFVMMYRVAWIDLHKGMDRERGQACYYIQASKLVAQILLVGLMVHILCKLVCIRAHYISFPDDDITRCSFQIGMYIVLFSSLLLAINKLNRVKVVVFLCLCDYITKILSIIVNFISIW